MQERFHQLRRAKATKAATPEEFYGFKAEDVVHVHLHKHGFGRGLWLRLRDGRVFDAAGTPSQQDRDWYEASAH